MPEWKIQQHKIRLAEGFAAFDHALAMKVEPQEQVIDVLFQCGRGDTARRSATLERFVLFHERKGRPVTIKQKQSLLYYLGYYDGEVDGIWGEKSQAAEQTFRRNHGVLDGDIRKRILEALPTAASDWWEEIEYFRPGEFACKCGGLCNGYPAQMEESLVRTADRVRKILGTACIVSSGLRCRQHNANVGGVSNSRHLTGKAMDFCAEGKTAQQVLAVVQTQPEIRYAYAIDGRFVHMDVD